ncbi:MAG: class I SAM-dependent methyltransferase [Pseudonocardiaceae bacterium]
MRDERSGAAVRAHYERFPYPSPNASAPPIYDTAIGLDMVVDDLSGCTVLDAGCGTGHRLVGMAGRFPEASFVGIDFSDHSLSIAAELARSHGCTNVEFARAVIGGPVLGKTFDVITSTGVIHHLSDPAAGIRWLAAHRSSGGLIYTWFYHPYGEFGRLLDRRLAMLLTGGGDVDQSHPLLAELKLSLTEERYGSRTAYSQEEEPVARLAADVDAFLHPIVHSYRFGEAASLFDGTVDWVVVSAVNWAGGARVLDATDWSGQEFGTLATSELFDSTMARELFSRMEIRAQLDCVEFRLRPTGFVLVAGDGRSVESCTARVAASAASANLLPGDLSDPHPAIEWT